MRKRNWAEYWRKRRESEKPDNTPLISINERLYRSGKLKKPTYQHQIKITPTSSFAERHSAFAKIQELGLSEVITKVCECFGKVNGKETAQILIKWN
jgi:hypothetical protein